MNRKTIRDDIIWPSKKIYMFDSVRPSRWRSVKNKNLSYQGNGQNKASGEIFGEDTVSTEEASYEKDISSDDDIIDSISKDQDYSGEAISGYRKSAKRQSLETHVSPDLSSNDIDAKWEEADTTGEESSLGSNATPDQDQVDEISKPWGLDYKSGEELDVRKKSRDLESKRTKDDELSS